MSAPEHRSSSRWPWIVLLVAVATIAVTLPLYRARTSNRTRTQVVTVTPRPAALPIRNCAVHDQNCRREAANGAVVDTVVRRFSGASVVDSYQLVDGSAARTVVRYIALVTSRAVHVAVEARCVPSAGTVPDREYGALSGAGPAHGVIVAGGPRGCSVAVTLDVPAGVAIPVAVARATAHDASLALTP